MLLTAFGIGIVIGFLFFEISGLTAGGIIVPGYLALFVNEPERLLVTVVISMIVYAIVYFISQNTVIFGRRRFFLMILIGFVIRVGFDNLQYILPETNIELQAIGYIIPGLIANEFFRQGILKTIMAMIIVVTLTFLLLNLFF
ncbi:MAG: poly-gamma-glutamate biosynthesis protein PgsC [Ignavibacteriae bacterium]|nr:poly-gamma-glutamate biosynthesis protein PgsC [Ignavibacteriota bacterium]